MVEDTADRAGSPGRWRRPSSVVVVVALVVAAGVVAWRLTRDDGCHAAVGERERGELPALEGDVTEEFAVVSEEIATLDPVGSPVGSFTLAAADELGGARLLGTSDETIALVAPGTIFDDGPTGFLGAVPVDGAEPWSRPLVDTTARAGVVGSRLIVFGYDDDDRLEATGLELVDGERVWCVEVGDAGVDHDTLLQLATAEIETDDDAPADVVVAGSRGGDESGSTVTRIAGEGGEVRWSATVDTRPGRMAVLDGVVVLGGVSQFGAPPTVTSEGETGGAPVVAVGADDGATRWRYRPGEIAGVGWESYVVGATDDTIVVLDRGAAFESDAPELPIRLVGLDAEGTQVWTTELDDPTTIEDTDVVVQDDVVLVGDPEGISAFSAADGSPSWRFDIGRLSVRGDRAAPLAEHRVFARDELVAVRLEDGTSAAVALPEAPARGLATSDGLLAVDLDGTVVLFRLDG